MQILYIRSYDFADFFCNKISFIFIKNDNDQCKQLKGIALLNFRLKILFLWFDNVVVNCFFSFVTKLIW